MAACNPETNYLGVEMHRPGVGHLLLKMEQQSLTNVRVIRHDAVEVVRQKVWPTALTGLFLFPGPMAQATPQQAAYPAAGICKNRNCQSFTSRQYFSCCDRWDDTPDMLRVMTEADVSFENCAGKPLFCPARLPSLD